MPGGSSWAPRRSRPADALWQLFLLLYHLIQPPPAAASAAVGRSFQNTVALPSRFCPVGAATDLRAAMDWQPRRAKAKQCAASSCCYPSNGQLRILKRQQALKEIVQKVKRGQWAQSTAVVLLFHAAWCPYSRSLLPLVECLPQHFPPSKIQFFSIDESDVGLRAVIQMGVDSFPMLQVVQPHPMRESGQALVVTGPRQLQHIIDRVARMTGVAPCSTREFVTLAANPKCPVPRLHDRTPGCAVVGGRSCPTPGGVNDWEAALTCERLLREGEPKPAIPQQDALGWAAVAFVVLRFGYPWARRLTGNGGAGAGEGAAPPAAAAAAD